MGIFHVIHCTYPIKSIMIIVLEVITKILDLNLIYTIIKSHLKDLGRQSNNNTLMDATLTDPFK